MAPFTSLVAPLLCLVAQVPDEIGLVRIDPDDKKAKKLWVTLNAPSAAPGDIVGELAANDRKWEKVGGKKIVRFAFGAQWDAKTYEEVVVVRELKKTKDRRLELLIYRTPPGVNSDTGKPVASTSKADFGVAVGDGRVVAVGPIDLEGDDRDEVAVVREAADGSLSLDVLTLPKTKKDASVEVVRSDATFGHAVSDAVVGLFGTDVDGDGLDELVVVRRDAGGAESLEVVRPPPTPFGECGPPLVSDDDVTPSEGFATVGVSRLRADLTEVCRPLLLQQHADGSQRLVHLELPSTVHGEVGAPLDVDADLDVVGFDSRILAAFGVRPTPKPPEPHEPFEGEWEAWFLGVYQVAPGEFESQWMGPFEGLVGTATEDAYLSLKFPPNTCWATDTVEGYVSAYGDQQTAYFKLPGFPYGPQIFFFPKKGAGLAAPGDYIVVSYPFGTIDQDDPFTLPTISGAGVGGTPIGELVTPKDEPEPDVLKASIMAYRFVRVP